MKNVIYKLNCEAQLYLNVSHVVAIHHSELQMGFFMDCLTDRSGSTQLFAKYDSEEKLKRDLKKVIELIKS
jgi:hypothetical protein